MKGAILEDFIQSLLGFLWDLGWQPEVRMQTGYGSWAFLRCSSFLKCMQITFYTSSKCCISLSYKWWVVKLSCSRPTSGTQRLRMYQRISRSVVIPKWAMFVVVGFLSSSFTNVSHQDSITANKFASLINEIEMCPSWFKFPTLLCD